MRPAKKMRKAIAKSFRATLERVKSGVNWIMIRVLLDVPRILGDQGWKKDAFASWKSGALAPRQVPFNMGFSPSATPKANLAYFAAVIATFFRAVVNSGRSSPTEIWINSWK